MTAMKMNEDRARLERRAEEIRYLGTQYAMNGVTTPPELEAEYARIQAALAEGEGEEKAGGPRRAPEPSGS